MSSNIIIPFVDPDAGAVSYWIIIKDGQNLEDLVTFEEAAEVIDALYDRDPCVPQEPVEEETDPIDEETATEEESAENKPDIDHFSDIMKEYLGFSIFCSTGNDGSYEARILVAVSHQDEQYKLVFDNGEELSRTHESENKTVHASVKRQSSYTLEFPITGDVVFEWKSMSYDEDGTFSQATPKISGSTLNFGREVTGSFVIRYQTEYDIITVQVYAPNSVYAGLDTIPKPIKCEVIGFYHGLVEEHTIEPPEISDDDDDSADLCDKPVIPFVPDNVSCYDSIRHTTKCQCTKKDLGGNYTYYEERGRPCPREFTCPNGEETCKKQIGGGITIVDGYASCPEEEYLKGSVGDPEYYLEKCCVPPDLVNLPPCKNITGVYSGGKTLTQTQIDNYPGAVFIAVGPKNGRCGDTHTSYVVPANNCCDGVDPIWWDSDRSAQTIGQNDQVLVYIAGGGGLPIDWEVHGQGFFLDAEHTKRSIQDAGGAIWVFTDDTACGSATIEATDGCSTASGTLRSTAGWWELKCESSTIPNACGCEGGGNNGVSLGGGTFESIDDEFKIYEVVSCATIGDGWSCGGPTSDECCAWYASAIRPNEWPPCISAADGYLSSSDTLCNPTYCAAFGPGRCGTCDAEGGVYEPSPHYAWDYIFKKTVVLRKVYEWVCE